jgi:hypothetical protein
MTISKKDFYDFAQLMAKDSKLLYEHQALHNSVYFAGYVLEAYIKIILIHHDDKNFMGHLGEKDFLSKINHLIEDNLYPNFFDTSILKKSSDYIPKKLFDGSNKATKAKWSINSRYKVTHWTDSKFSEDIQKELKNIRIALAKLRIDGVIS